MTGAFYGRYEANRRRGVVDRYVGPAARKRINDDLAAKAEWFFGYRYGHEADAISNAYVCDFQASPSCIDVKWTEYADGALVLPETGKDRSHFCSAYVLVVGRQPVDFRVAGWAWGHRMEKNYVEKGAARYVRNAGGWACEQESEHFWRNTDVMVASLMGWPIVRPDYSDLVFPSR